MRNELTRQEKDKTLETEKDIKSRKQGQIEGE